MCALAYSFRQQYVFVIMDLMLCLLSLLTLVMLWKVFKNKELRRLYSLVEADLKMLFWVGFGAYLMGALNSFVYYGYKFVSFWFVKA